MTGGSRKKNRLCVTGYGDGENVCVYFEDAVASFRADGRVTATGISSWCGIAILTSRARL